MYWGNEVTGKMKKIVMAFLEHKELSKEDLLILKKYIIQWIESTAISFPYDFNNKIMGFNQDQLQKYVVNDLLTFGIDPF